MEETPERPVTIGDEERKHEEARAAKRVNEGDGSYPGRANWPQNSYGTDPHASGDASQPSSS